MRAHELTFAEARVRVLRAAKALPPVTMPVSLCAGRPLREDVAAPHDLPRFDNSAMDGFAVRAVDLVGATAARPVVLHVTEIVPAGRTATLPLEPGKAIRLMTGAMIPPGADTIVPFEDCEPIERNGVERVRFRSRPPAGQHVRNAGADARAGERLLDRGRELSPFDLGLLAGVGAANVRVGPRPKAAILSTGDELIGVDEPLRPGAIRDSNSIMLAAMLADAGCEVVLAERLRDVPELVAGGIAAALASCDVVLSIGGVSAGDFDPVKLGLERLSGIELWRVAMKPGRPQAFGSVDGRLFFGLPGNPASVACVFEALARPALRRLQGYTRVDRPRIRVRVSERIDSRRGRTDFVRATLSFRDDAWWATPAGAQISGHLTPQSRAHALVVVPDHRGELEAGGRAAAMLLRWPR